MATYKFRKPSGEIFEIEMSIHDIDKYKSDNPEYKQLIYDLNYCCDPGLKNRNSDGFRDVIKQIKKANPGNTIDI